MADGKELNENLGQAKENIKGVNNEAIELRNIFAEIQEALKNNVRGAGDLAAATREGAKDAGAFAEFSKKLQGYNTKNLQDQRVANGLINQYNNLKSFILKNDAEIAYLQEIKNNLEGEQLDRANKLLEDRQNEKVLAESLAERYQEIAENAERIQTAGDKFGNVASMLKEIPVVGGLLASSFERSRKKVQEMEDGGTRFQRNMVATSETLLGLGTGALAFLVASLTKADTNTTNLAKQLAISKDQARELRGAFNQIALDSGTAALNANNLTESFIELGNAVGAVSGFNSEQIEQQGRLTNLIGLQAEEAANLTRFGILNKETTRSQMVDIVEQVELLKQQTGIQLDGRKVLAEVARINGQLGAQYGYNTQEIARAVIQANRLGLSLQDTQGIASNLLDFEQSITNELTAELFTNKNLNLERARLLAINGKTAEATEEIVRQLGSAEEFTKLNVLQQESLAKAAGMTTDQLADSLRQREILNSLGVSNIKQLEEQGRLDELRNARGGEQILQQYEQQSAADALANAMAKIQGAIGAMVEGPLGGLIDGFVNVANSAGLIQGAMAAIAGLSLIRVIGSIVSLGVSLAGASVGAIATASAITLGLGAVAVIAGMAAMSAQAKKQAEEARNLATVDDMIMPAGYGDRIISTPKGSVALNNNDTIVAGTNLGQGSQDTKRTNMLLEKLIKQNSDKPQLSPVGLYEVQ